MRQQQAVKRYARMFINSMGLEDVPRALDELAVVRELMEKSGEFRGLLVNPRFTFEEREKALKKISERLYLSDGTARFVLRLAEGRAASALGAVIRTVTALYLEKKKRARATVITPVDTDGQYEDALKASLKKLTGRDIDIEYVVDPSLLGGVLVKVGSTMYDSSIKGQLRLLKDDLVKR